jgi:cytochrome c-type biogenesis protein
MLALGLLIASLSLVSSAVTRWALAGSIVTVGVTGALLLFDVPIFSRIRTVSVPGVSNRYVLAFLYGVLFGPMAFPCSAGFAVGIFALSSSIADFGLAIVAFLAFGLGMGTPLLLLAFLGQSRQRAITRFVAQRASLLNRVAGVFLLGIGAFLLIENWAFLTRILG